MQLQPVTRYQHPTYPTARQTSQQPAVLRQLPRRWRSKPLLLVTMAGLAGTASMLTGCFSLIPHMGKALMPPLLSEEEALQIIQTEAQQYGINFVPTERTLPLSLSHPPQEPQRPLRLKLDGEDQQKQLAFEYVSSADLCEWRELNPAFIDPKHSDPAVPLLTSALKQSPEAGRVAVFSTPDNCNTEQNHNLLRAQVQGYLEWLKSQGVI